MPMTEALFTAEESATLKEALKRLVPQADALAESFYAHLFARAPGIRALFPASMDEQYYKLITMISMLVEATDKPEEFEAECRESGARHRGYGAQPRHFTVVGESLMAALRETKTPPTPEEEALWLKFYGEAARLMISEP